MTIYNELKQLEHRFVEKEKEIERLRNLAFSKDLQIVDFEEVLYDEEIINQETEKSEKVKKAVVKKLKQRTLKTPYKANEASRTKYKTAILIVGIDHSGSMGIYEKYMGKCIYYWLNALLEDKYRHVELRFIAHSTEANEVSEDIAFDKGVSGGTIVSSCFREMSKLAEEYSYENEDSDLFYLYISDGDNLTSDNARTESILLNRILHKCKQMIAITVNQYSRHTTLQRAFEKAHSKSNFTLSEIVDKNDIKNVLKKVVKKL